MNFAAFEIPAHMQKTRRHERPFRVSEADSKGSPVMGGVVCHVNSLGTARLIAGALQQAGVTHAELCEASTVVG